MGEFIAARRHLERVVELYDFETHQHLVDFSNNDPKCISLAWASHFLWMLGYPDQAVQASNDQLTLARRLRHPFNLGFSLTTGCGAYIYRRDADTLLERRSEGMALAREQGLDVFDAFTGLLWVSETQLNCGLVEEAYQSASDALDWWLSITAKVCAPYMKAIMGAALGRTDRVPDGLALIDEALSDSDSTGDKWHYAEAHRLKGELLLTGTGAGNAAAEQCFKDALEISRAQDAKGWELRAATSLARLWQGQGKTKEAHDLLAPVYDWFTEGFDTADLKDAKALLAELAT